MTNSDSNWILDTPSVCLSACRHGVRAGDVQDDAVPAPAASVPAGLRVSVLPPDARRQQLLVRIGGGHVCGRRERQGPPALAAHLQIQVRVVH